MHLKQKNKKQQHTHIITTTAIIVIIIIPIITSLIVVFLIVVSFYITAYLPHHITPHQVTSWSFRDEKQAFKVKHRGSILGESNRGGK